jgi:hypothetical protein
LEGAERVRERKRARERKREREKERKREIKRAESIVVRTLDSKRKRKRKG